MQSPEARKDHAVRIAFHAGPFRQFGSKSLREQSFRAKVKGHRLGAKKSCAQCHVVHRSKQDCFGLKFVKIES